MPQLFGANELVADVHDRQLCIGCGACVDLCPYFKNYKGKTSQLFACNLPQGRCFAYCPKVEVDLDWLYRQQYNVAYDGSALGPFLKIAAARAGAQMTKGRYQGGGVVSALMAFALKNNLVDVAVLTRREGLSPAPVLVTRWEDVVQCAGSKFMAAPTLAGLNQAVKQGFQKVGVVGTPCQMTAVAQMRTNPLQKEEHHVPVALAIGLFCNWSLDTRQLTDLLAEKLDIERIDGMDIPPPPANVMVLKTDEGDKEIPLSEIKPLIPHTCFTCLDMTSELADLSVGMYEGRPEWNTLIIRSQKGQSLVDTAVNEGFVELEAMPEEVVTHLSGAAAAKKERSMRILRQRGLINSTNGTHAAVRMPEAVAKRILP